jgi:hypothetical protein
MSSSTKGGSVSALLVWPSTVIDASLVDPEEEGKEEDENVVDDSVDDDGSDTVDTAAATLDRTEEKKEEDDDVELVEDDIEVVVKGVDAVSGAADEEIEDSAESDGLLLSSLLRCLLCIRCWC